MRALSPVFRYPFHCIMPGMITAFLLLPTRTLRSVLIGCLLFACSADGQELSVAVDEQYGMAAGFYERGEYAEAIDTFRDLIQSHPETPQAAMSHFFLGESLLQLSDYRAAYPAYQIFLKRFPDHPNSKRARFRLAECASQLDWSEQAVSLWERFIDTYPTDRLNEFALNFLGELRLRRNEPQLARRVFERALQQFPNSSQSNRSRFGLAKSLQMMGQVDQATRFYQMMTSDRASHFFGLSRIQLGIISFDQADYARAREYFRVAGDVMLPSSNRVELEYWLAKIELATGSPEAAFEYLSSIADSQIHEHLKAAIVFDAAVAASRIEEYAASLKWLKQLQTTWPDSRWADVALQLEIELSYKQQLYDEALQRIATFQEDFPAHRNLPQIMEYRGRIHYDRQEYAATVDTFQSLIDSYSDHPDADRYISRWQYFTGLGHLGRQEFELATRIFDTIEVHPDDLVLRANVLLAKAAAAASLNRPQQAKEELERYLATRPDEDQANRARSELAIACARIGDWERASRVLEEMQTTSADSQRLLETNLLLADLALQDRRFEQAEQRFRALANPGHPRFFVVRGLSGLAWTRMTRGDAEDPVPAFQRLLREFPETPFAAESAVVCGRYFEDNREFEAALKMYTLVSTDYPDSDLAPTAELRRAYSLHQMGGPENLAAAERLLDQYLATRTVLVDEATYQLAWLHLDTGREEQARAAFQAIVKEHPKSRYWPDAAYRIAEQRLVTGDLTAADDLLQRLLTMPTKPGIAVRVRFLVGQIEIERKNWPAASTYMQAVLAQTDDEDLRKKARYWIAECLFQTGEHAAALEQLQRLTDDPDRIADQRLAWIHLRRAQCQVALENWSTAIELAQSGQRQHPGFEALHEFDFVIGQAHAAQGRLADARKSYQKVVSSPNGRTTRVAAMAQWRIGEAWFHQQSYELAIAAFYKVDSLYAYPKWRAAALLEAGKCQEHLGNWRHAIKLYQQLIERFPDSELQSAARDRLRLATRQASRKRVNRNQ